MKNGLALLISIFLALPAAADGKAARSNPWGSLAGPLAGSGPHGEETRAIGTQAPALGCLQNAREFPVSSDLWEFVNAKRRRHYGHTDTEEFLKYLGQWSTKEAKHGKLVIGDISQAAGGPMSSGHASHQMGLDIDIRFALAPLGQRMPDETREGYPEVRAALHEVFKKQDGSFALTSSLDAKRWTPAFEQLLQKSAQHSKVERIFVTAPIKKHLCEKFKPTKPGESYPAWLLKVQPYFGHDAHFHVRLGCPKNSPECVNQKPVKIEPGDTTSVGCEGPAMRWWYDLKDEGSFFQGRIKKINAGKPEVGSGWEDKIDKLPDACKELLRSNRAPAAAAKPPKVTANEVGVP